MGPKGRDPRPKEPNNRPGWKGPSYIKKPKLTPPKPANSKEKSVTTAPKNSIPLELQQLLLNIFSNTFSDILQSEGLSSALQEVKQALFERDFERAFGREQYLESYAARFSPTRALCYAQVLVGVWGYFRQCPKVVGEDLSTDSVQKDLSLAFRTGQLQVVCFGGAAAEVVAFGGLVSYLNLKSSNSSSEDDISPKEVPDNLLGDEAKSTAIKLLLVDTAAWGEVVRKLSDGLETPPILSKYASASAKANNPPLIPKDSLITTFQQADALSLNKQEISKMLGEDPSLITLLFTLNELYTSSISKTTTFLLHLTAVTKPNTLLLIVDSPGSYSETAIGKDLKKYPMQWLLDHTLLEKAKLADADDSLAAWEKVVSEDSEWFRLVEKLRYPIALEDMRYQIHLYRRV